MLDGVFTSTHSNSGRYTRLITMGLAMLYNTIVIIAATMLMSIKLAKVFVVFMVLFFLFVILL